MSRFLRGIAVMICAASPLLCPAAMDAGLKEYVAKPEAAFQWNIRDRQRTAAGAYLDVAFTSQVWQGIKWEHQLVIYEPRELVHRDIALLFITGGSNGSRPSPNDMFLGFTLARLCKARCALLRQVPNQPLLDGHREDSLISETFVRYLDTKDETWPLLFPMAKSAVKAMDAVQQIVRQESGESVKRFVVTGASKRGWTTWLTSAVDRRVAAMAPMVIDMLNIPRQLPHQLEVWGKYSEQIGDYTRRGLTEVLKEPAGNRLTELVDPFSYRQQYDMPKLIINGTNDRYWTLDAMDLYWDDLPGPKFALYLPNAGHGLDQNRSYATNGISALLRHVATGEPFPRMKWDFRVTAGDRLRLTVSSDPAPRGTRAWIATTSNRDFRDSEWTTSSFEATADGFVSEIARPVRGHAAILGDLEFAVDGLTYHLSTQVGQIGAR